MKDFCQVNTDLRRGKTCFSDNDKLNKVIEINKIRRRIKIMKIIIMISLLRTQMVQSIVIQELSVKKPAIFRLATS